MSLPTLNMKTNYIGNELDDFLDIEDSWTAESAMETIAAAVLLFVFIGVMALLLSVV